MKNWSELLSKGISAAANAAKTVLKAVITFWGECTEAENIVAANRAATYQAVQHQQCVINHSKDYDEVANLLLGFLISNATKCGLSEKLQIEDIYSGDLSQAIHMSQNGSLIFCYEVDRCSSDMFAGGMKRVQPPKVPTADIKAILIRRLPTYAYRRSNYSFNGLTVNDIPDNRIRITISVVKPKGIQI